jgi:hypothetical protein
VARSVLIAQAVKEVSMDEFSLIVLEDTLQLVTEVLPPELTSDCLSGIRECLNSIATDPSDCRSARRLRLALNELSEVARENNKFWVEARLQSIANQFDVSDVA